VSTFWQDLRFAVRTLIRTPVVSGVAILTLALGIGANSAIFSVVNGVLLKPLAYEDPGQLVFVTSAFPSMGFDEFWISEPEYRELRDWSESLIEVGAYNTSEASITGTDSPIRVTAATVTAEFFAVMGVPARMGRIINEADDAPGADPVAVLSYELWQRAFGADQGILGTTYTIDGRQRTIVGVMPPRFDVHDNEIELWLPLNLDPANPRPRSNHFLYAVARLAPGVPLERARAELATLIARWEGSDVGHRPSAEGHPIQFGALRDEVVGDVQPALFVLLGAVGFVLLIACANVGNLLLARAEARQKEIALRTALGAGRGRLARQFLTESLVLSLLGGVLGLALGWIGVRALLATNPDSLPRIREVTLDLPVLLFTFVVAVLAGVVFGLAPLLHVIVRDVSGALREGGQRTTAGRARLILRRGLVASELALAVILVVGAGLMLRSFSQLQRVDPGFRVDDLLAFQLYLPPANYEGPPQQWQFLDELANQLEAIPGAVSASTMSGLPPDRRINANDMDFDGIEPTPDGPPHNVDFWQFIGDDYLETMGIEIAEGRTFGSGDLEGSLPVALVNETMARTFWPGQSPIGRRVRPESNDIPWFTVVGVVRDVKQQGLDRETGTEIYFYYPQVAAAIGFAPRTMHLVVRTSVPPTALARTVRETVWSLDATLPVADLQPMSGVMHDAVARPRFLTLLLITFGAVALLLAAVGTYGVMSYTVAERMQEMGIRLALGASSRTVIKLVLVQGMQLAALGLLIGTVGAIAATRVMQSILFGVGTHDMLTFTAVPILLAAVATTACLLPALRATRVDPASVLKAE
jgi:predicted permease